MQIRQSTFDSNQFRCPFDHEETGNCLLKHGTYDRYISVHGPTTVAIPRFLCKFTGKTLSILPDAMLPYWPLPVSELDEHFQQRSAANEALPEQACKTTSDLPERAWNRFCSPSRLQSLVDYFGQRLPLGRTPGALWQAIKRVGGTVSEILCELSQAGKSLLGDYQCLRPSRSGT